MSSRFTIFILLLVITKTGFSDVSVSIESFNNDLIEESSEEIKEWNEQKNKEEEARRRSEKNTDSSIYCHGNGLTEGMRNVCLASVHNQASYCHGSGLTEGMRNSCLASVHNQASYCHGSGLTEGMRNMCLAISNAR